MGIWVLMHTAENPDEAQVLAGLQALDTQIVGAIYDRYFPEVYRYVRYRLDDEYTAEDVTSEVFVRLLEAARSGRGPKSNLKSWLLSTASHIITDYLRRAYRHPEQSIPEELLDAAYSPLGEIEHREKVRAFKQAYAQLTPEQQHVLALRFGVGYSIEEVATIMKKSTNAVKVLQFRALAALQRKIKEYYD